MLTNEIIMAPQQAIGPNVEYITCKLVEKTPLLDAALLGLICMGILMLIACAISLVRLHFVSRLRRKLINEASRESRRLINSELDWKLAHEWYEELPDFDAMMRAFWVWPVEKMVPESCAQYVIRALKEKNEKIQSATKQPE